MSQQSRFPYGMPHSGPGVPLHLLQWPASPSPIPSWAMLGSTSAPVYTMATSPTPATVPSSVVPPAPASGTIYDSLDRTLVYGAATVSAAPAVFEGGSTSATPTIDHGAHGGAPAPPRFYKLEFATYDGGVDPLNWLNQCEQFFRG